MALRDFWRRDRGEQERTRYPLDPLSRDSWHDESEARYGAQPYRNPPEFDDENRRLNERWQNSYSGPGYQRFRGNESERPSGRASGSSAGQPGGEYGGSSNNPFLGDHPLRRAGSAYDSGYFGGNNGMPRTQWRGDQSNESYDELVYGGDLSAGGPNPWGREQPRGVQSQGEHRGRGPKGYRRSDERIKEDVCQCLTDDQHIDATNIEVAVTDREVILTGSVQSRAEKRHAEDLIERLPGVRDVINSLRVENPQSTSTFARPGL